MSQASDFVATSLDWISFVCRLFQVLFEQVWLTFQCSKSFSADSLLPFFRFQLGQHCTLYLSQISAKFFSFLLFSTRLDSMEVKVRVDNGARARARTRKRQRDHFSLTTVNLLLFSAGARLFQPGRTFSIRHTRVRWMNGSNEWRQ